MYVYRISVDKFAKSLIASGKKARWNKDNQFTLYAGQSRSLSSLELVVHQNIMTSLNYRVMVIRLADDEHLFTKITLKDLPKNWKEIAAYPVLQEIGNQWYENNTSLVLQVPSVIIPQESNFIVNLNHPDNKKKYISLENTEPFFWDSRLMTGINPASIQ